MNLSDKTRKQQILDYLTERKGQWVDGSELATESVGGSEGLRRLRELRGDHMIEQRRHPAFDRDVWQYRLMDKPGVSPLRPEAPKERTAPKPRGDHPTRMQFGTSRYCSVCGGRGKKDGKECLSCEGWGWI